MLLALVDPQLGFAVVLLLGLAVSALVILGLAAPSASKDIAGYCFAFILLTWPVGLFVLVMLRPDGG